MSQDTPLLERIDAAWTRLSERVSELGPDGLMLTAPDGWTVKDHLAHVGAWEHSLLAVIEGRDPVAGMGLRQPVEEHVDAINDAVWKLHREATPEQAISYFRESHAQLMAGLTGLSEADLQKPYSHFQASEPNETRPVIGWIVGDTYEHYAEHLGWIDQIKESSAAR